MHPLAGVYAASLTPLNPDYSLNLEDLPKLLDFLAQRGCHGALLLGTTGEGPSFSPEERLEIFKTAVQIRQVHPNFRLFAGTGTPSLEETKQLTKSAFDLGFEGVVVLPPYYFRSVSDDGLYAWFAEVLRNSVPTEGVLLGYHFPALSGVPFSFDLLSRLKNSFPERFGGLKDSSSQLVFAREIGESFGTDLLILNGNDSIFVEALEYGAVGCITALANLRSPDLRAVWDAHMGAENDAHAQARLKAAREVMEHHRPFAPTLKSLLPRFHDFPVWQVRPPLLPIIPEVADQAEMEMRKAITTTDYNLTKT